MNDHVATLEEVGIALEKARIAFGATDQDVCDAAEITTTTLHRWKKGQGDAGARSLALAALRVGKTPNDFLLRSHVVPAFANNMSDEKKVLVSRIFKGLDRLEQLAGGTLPYEVCAEYIDVTVNQIEGKGALPAGSTIRLDGGSKVFEPPPKKAVRQSIPAMFKVGEDPAPYGEENKGE